MRIDIDKAAYEVAAQVFDRVLRWGGFEAAAKEAKEAEADFRRRMERK